MGVSKKQRPAPAALRVQNSRHRLAGPGSMAEQRDGLPALPHGPQRFQRLFLMLLQLQGSSVQHLAPLGREVVLDLLEPRAAAKEDPQLILHRLRLELHLPHRPAIHVPAHIDHTVLLEKVVIKFSGGDKVPVVGALVVDLNGYPAPAALQKKIRVPAVLIDVVEMVLRIEVSGLLRAKSFAEQLNKQILCDTAGGRVLDSHSRYLISP